MRFNQCTYIQCKSKYVRDIHARQGRPNSFLNATSRIEYGLLRPATTQYSGCPSTTNIRGRRQTGNHAWENVIKCRGSRSQLLSTSSLARQDLTSEVHFQSILCLPRTTSSLTNPRNSITSYFPQEARHYQDIISAYILHGQQKLSTDPKKIPPSCPTPCHNAPLRNQRTKSRGK